MMTEKGAAFVERMAAVDEYAKSGMPIFASLAAGLEDDDWLLVYVAARKLAAEVVAQGAEPSPAVRSTGEPQS